jgi:hypothetical protein
MALKIVYCPTAWFVATPPGLCIWLIILIIPDFSFPTNFHQAALDGLI